MVLKKKIKKAVPDTSVIIEGIISRMLKNSKISIGTIIFHEAVLAELESQANKGRDIGYQGLEEVSKLRKIALKRKIGLEFKGSRPGDFEIKFAKSGEIDSLIRDLAFKEKATLITADIVQSKVAEAKGVDVVLYRFPKVKSDLVFEKYFDSKTSKIMIREGSRIIAKKGRPGNWKLIEINRKIFSKDEVKDLAKDILDKARLRKDSFIEYDKRGFVVAKVGVYNVLIVKNSVSNVSEIFISRRIIRKKFSDYKLGKDLVRNIDESRGLLVSGPNDSGKTTFIQSLVERFSLKGLDVSVLESQKSLVLPKRVSGYLLNGSNDVLDVLMISKPDIVILDEIRSDRDIEMFRVLVQSGFKCVGVLSSFDSGRKRMDFLAPSTVDAVIFMSNGKPLKK